MPDVQEIRATTDEEVTKQSFRKKIWDHITKNELANFPLSVHSRIPNFKGAAEAAQRILDLEEFKRAKVVKINPDKPQESVRLLALEANKEILVPIPRLKSGLFLHVAPSASTGKDELKNIATRRGLQQFGKPLGLDSDIKVDLLVLGAVCVSRTGYRIGKGEGFADLEFAIMMEMGAVNSETTVITTVHDCQIVDDLPSSLFQRYDVPIDIIVTPTQTIYVNERLKKPVGIFWDILTARRVKSMLTLQQLQQRDEKDGKIVVLKEEDSNDERRRSEKRWIKRNNSKRLHRTKREVTDSDGTAIAENDAKETKDDPKVRGGRFSRRRGFRERKGDGDHESSVNENNTEEPQKAKPRRRRTMRPRARANIDFSLKLSNIKSNVRVRHLKNALLERGVRANDITWHGQRGYCYLHFGKLRNKDSEPDQPVQVDSIVANLQHLKLVVPATTDSATDAVAENDEVDDDDEGEDNDEYIVVEPAKPITRIEITDVTAV